jgi:hypothetical protein
MDSVTEENVEKLIKEHGSKVTELETIKSTTINKMWLNELQALRGQYVEYKEERIRLMNENQKNKTLTKTVIKKNVKKPMIIVD